MKLMMISALYPPLVIGGAERSTQKVAIALTQLGWQVEVLTLVPSGASELPAHAIEDGVSVHRMPLANLYWPYDGQRSKPGALARLAWHLWDTVNPLMAKRVAALAGRLQPDVVMTHNLQGFSTAVWNSLAELGLPIVHVVHDFALLCPRTVLFRDGRNCAHGDGRCRECRWLTRPRFGHAEHISAVVTVSEAVLRIHRAHGLFEHAPATVILNGAAPGVRPRAAVPARAASAPFTFGFLGRVDAAKGIETLLQASTELAAQGCQFQVQIGGLCDPDYLSTLKARWPLANVRYLGFVEPETFLAGLDTLVVPTLALEALGNVVFEAYFQGVPVIGTSQGGVPEMIDIGRTGLVFPAGDASALALFMRRMLDDREGTRAMAEAALLRAQDFVSEIGLMAYDRVLRSQLPGAA